MARLPHTLPTDIPEFITEGSVEYHDPHNGHFSPFGIVFLLIRRTPGLWGGANRRTQQAVVRHLSSFNKNFPPIFMIFDRVERHEAIVFPVFGVMNVTCDFAVSGYEIAHLLLSFFVTQENKDGQLISERI